MSTFSKGFSETTGPILFKFHMQNPSKEGKKINIIGPNHMTKMGVMPIYGTKIKKKRSPEPLGR